MLAGPHSLLDLGVLFQPHVVVGSLIPCVSRMEAVFSHWPSAEFAVFLQVPHDLLEVFLKLGSLLL